MLAALRERDTTGKGAYLDLSLQEAALAFTTIRPGLDIDGEFRGHLWPGNDLFETAGGEPLVLCLVEDHFWSNFVKAVGDLAPDLRSDRYAFDAERRRNGDELHARIHEVMRMLTADEWMRRFEGHDVPAERVLGTAQATRSNQVTARDTVMTLGGERHVPFPVHANGGRGAALRSLAPALGEHNREVLAELGYSGDELDALEASGLFGVPSEGSGI
jgi:crotonobetainyl-CoA:carnitine CoA-transferase CaiB-like acyl-CoA transferase